MADRGHELTEEILKEIEDRCKDEYETSAREMRKKYRDYMAKFETERKAQYELWQSGKITQKEYTDWVYRHTMVGKRWEQMANTLAADMEHTNEIARGIAADRMPDVFALNANYSTYQIEHDGRIDTSFTLYNHDTAAYLMEDQKLMPGPSTRKAAQIAANKDMQWNYRKIQSAVLQGVLQGESPYEVAKRLTGVAQMNYNAAVRYARTMGTNAQNAGRYESYHRAKSLGVDLKIEWSATLDGRTRHEHRMLDGQRRDVDEPFVVDGVKIMWPAQSSGPGSSDIPQSLIWNCRCTLLAWVKGFEGETVKSSPKMVDMTYDEWKHAKEPKPKRENKEKTIEDANAFGTKMLQEAYEAHRTANETRSVPLADMGSRADSIVHADYSNISTQSADAFNDVIVQLNKEFDTPLASVRTMTKEEALFRKNAFASVKHNYSTDTAEMLINPVKCRDYDALTQRVKELSDKGYAVKIKPGLWGEYIPTHEYAHSLVSMLDPISNKTNWVNANYAPIRAARTEILAIYDKYMTDVGDRSRLVKSLELQIITGTDIENLESIQKQYFDAKASLDAVKLSDYSLINADEFMAEAFTFARIGEGHNPYSDEVMRVLVKYFGRR